MVEGVAVEVKARGKINEPRDKDQLEGNLGVCPRNRVLSLG